MVSPKTSHSGEQCIGLYLPPLRGYLGSFFASHKEEELKKAAKAVGGACNQRACFLKSTSEAKKISKASGVTRASVMFIPRKQLEKDIVDGFDASEYSFCVGIIYLASHALHCNDPQPLSV